MNNLKFNLTSDSIGLAAAGSSNPTADIVVPASAASEVTATLRLAAAGLNGGENLDFAYTVLGGDDEDDVAAALAALINANEVAEAAGITAVAATDTITLTFTKRISGTLTGLLVEIDQDAFSETPSIIFPIWEHELDFRNIKKLQLGIRIRYTEVDGGDYTGDPTGLTAKMYLGFEDPEGNIVYGSENDDDTGVYVINLITVPVESAAEVDILTPVNLPLDTFPRKGKLVIEHLDADFEGLLDVYGYQ